MKLLSRDLGGGGYHRNLKATIRLPPVSQVHLLPQVLVLP